MLSLALSLAFASPQPNLILVSLDTTRADALSCDGQVPDALANTPPTTPALCAIGDEGLRFTRFFAHAPTTLSSHTSMFTGLDPHGHGVPRNGFPVEPGLRTLAQRLQEQGWSTLATIGSQALEPAMGLNRGFDVYDHSLPAERAGTFQDTADGVVDRALKLVDSHAGDGPVFLFVHLYDPHAPYEAPEGWRDRYTDPAYMGPWRDDITTPVRELTTKIDKGTADPRHQRYLTGRYLDEVAWTDHQVNRLVEGLQERHLLDHSLLVITADHGETLTDFAPFAWSHGSEVTTGALRVPLIWRASGMPMASGQVVRRQAAMDGLAKTLELAMGLEPTLGTGHDFWDLVRPGPTRTEEGWPEGPVRPVYMEATRPRQLEPESGWNNLDFFRGVRAGGWAMQAAPIYDLAPHWVAEHAAPPDAGALPVLAAMLRSWDASAPPHRDAALAPSTEEALKTLGYLE
jgi:arylsulfatase A-like enzyme